MCMYTRCARGHNSSFLLVFSLLLEKSPRQSDGDEMNRSHDSSLDTPTRRRVRQRHPSGEASESDLDLLESDVGSDFGSPIKVSHLCEMMC